MTPQQADRCFETERVGEVIVVRFTRGVILSGQQADTVGGQLLAVLGQPGQQRLLLDFANVCSLSSTMLGTLLKLKSTAESAGGRVALCNLHPDIREIMEITRLTQVLPIYPGEQEALQSF